MTHNKNNETQRSRRFPLLLLLLLFPVLAHTVLVGLSVYDTDFVEFKRLDLIVFLLVVLYLCGALLLAINRRYLPRFLCLIYACLLTLVGIEISLSRVLPMEMGGVPWSPGKHIRKVNKELPGLNSPVEFTANSIGVRGPEVQLRDMDLRILCVGGSTTQCLLVTDQQSWPWRVQDQLTARLGKKVFVGNTGKSAAFTLHHDYVLRNYSLVPQFDWVVVLCGINDMTAHVTWKNYETRRALVSQEALIPRFDHAMYYRKLALARVAKRIQHYWGSPTVVEDEAGNWINEEKRLRRLAQKQGTLGEYPSDQLDSFLQVYRQDLLRIISACHQNRVKLVMLTQPMMWEKGLPEDLEDLLYLHQMGKRVLSTELSAEIIRKYNATMIDVCREKEIACIDLAAVIPKDTTAFYDDAHFNISGCEKVAAVVTDFFVTQNSQKQ